MEVERSSRRWAKKAKSALADDENIQLLESSPFLIVHLACLCIPLVGFSYVALSICVATYLLRVFALTAGFHRYFSHRAFRTSRPFQFILAFLGTSAAQLGPIWWASHHRHHHEHSDTEEDIHSPSLRGFLWSHMGWIMCRKYADANDRLVGDLTRYPELRWLDRFHVVPPFLLGFLLYGLGAWLAAYAPGLGTTGWQMVIWGFFVSTVMVYHVTFMINSVTHMFGSKRFLTHDESRNSFWLALLTMGEGWHNNHHRYPVSARQGLYWWEIDVTYLVLRLLQKVGLIWGIKAYPSAVFEEARLLNGKSKPTASATAATNKPSLSASTS